MALKLFIWFHLKGLFSQENALRILTPQSIKQRSYYLITILSHKDSSLFHYFLYDFSGPSWYSWEKWRPWSSRAARYPRFSWRPRNLWIMPYWRPGNTCLDRELPLVPTPSPLPFLQPRSHSSPVGSFSLVSNFMYLTSSYLVLISAGYFPKCCMKIHSPSLC